MSIFKPQYFDIEDERQKWRANMSRLNIRSWLSEAECDRQEREYINDLQLWNDARRARRAESLVLLGVGAVGLLLVVVAVLVAVFWG